jgi:hypothetical protein
MLIRQPNGQLQNNTSMWKTTTDQTRTKPRHENKGLQLIYLKSKEKSKGTKRVSVIMGTQ